MFNHYDKSCNLGNQHEPKIKAVRVNAQITEVKQSMSRRSSRNGDHLFSQFGYDWQKY